KQQQHDDQDDDQFGRSEAHRTTRLQARATRLTASSSTIENGTAATLTTSDPTPSSSHRPSWSRTSSTVPTRRPLRHSSRETPSSTPGNERSAKRRKRR